MRNYSVSQNIFAKYFFKEKMWGSLKSQGVAVQLPLTEDIAGQDIR